MDMIGLTIIAVAAIVGWKVATIGLREIKGMALVIAGLTAMDTVAVVPYLSVEFFLRTIANYAALVCIPFAVAAGIRRLQAGSR